MGDLKYKFGGMEQHIYPAVLRGEGGAVLIDSGILARCPG